MAQTEFGVTLSDFLHNAKTFLRRFVYSHSEVDTSGVAVDVVEVVDSIESLMGSLDDLERLEVASNLGVDGSLERTHPISVFSSQWTFFRASENKGFSNHIFSQDICISCQIPF